MYISEQGDASMWIKFKQPFPSYSDPILCTTNVSFPSDLVFYTLFLFPNCIPYLLAKDGTVIVHSH